MQPPSGVIYAVHVTCPQHLKVEVLDWLKQHIEEVVQAGNFLGADLWESEPLPLVFKPETAHFAVHYLAPNSEALELYFAGSAQTLRQQGVDRFAGQIQVTRQILQRPWRWPRVN